MDISPIGGGSIWSVPQRSQGGPVSALFAGPSDDQNGGLSSLFKAPTDEAGPTSSLFAASPQAKSSPASAYDIFDATSNGSGVLASLFGTASDLAGSQPPTGASSQQLMQWLANQAIQTQGNILSALLAGTQPKGSATSQADQLIALSLGQNTAGQATNIFGLTPGLGIASPNAASDILSSFFQPQHDLIGDILNAIG
jgi:hypothetical protein